jgi:hypothetical protein
VTGVNYLTGIPKPLDVPPGRIVVHNHDKPASRLGTRGFRAWTDEPSDRYGVCGCGWAPELGPHYRARRAWGESGVNHRRR